MDRVPVVLLIAFLLAVSGCKPDTGGKHLFILSGQSNMVGLDHQAFFNPRVEQAFGRDKVIVVKDAKGGQPIRRWFKDWESPLTDTAAVRGDLYDSLMHKVYAQIKDQKIRTVTFVWMQGERDARLGLGAVYEASLLGLYDQLSKDLNRTDVHFVIGRLSDFDLPNEKYPHWTMVREAQVRVGEARPGFAWVNTDDLNDGLNEKGTPIKNDLHMSGAGYEELGKRFAERAIQLIRQQE
ncbi:MAG: acetyl xylan esterase [Bacteroidetes bacterium]|nr:MAG: acetyl xylan esterase [Bacteroidota bacterium]